MKQRLRYYQETLFCLLLVLFFAATGASWLYRTAVESRVTLSYPLQVERVQALVPGSSAPKDGGLFAPHL